MSCYNNNKKKLKTPVCLTVFMSTLNVIWFVWECTLLSSWPTGRREPSHTNTFMYSLEQIHRRLWWFTTSVSDKRALWRAKEQNSSTRQCMPDLRKWKRTPRHEQIGGVKEKEKRQIWDTQKHVMIRWKCYISPSTAHPSYCICTKNISDTLQWISKQCGKARERDL